MQINLIEEKDNNYYLHYLLWGSLIFILIVSGILNIHNYRILLDLNKELEEVENVLSTYIPYDKEFRNIKSDLLLLKKNKTIFRWGKAVGELGYTVPEGLIVTEYFVEGDHFTIEGTAKTEKVMMLFVKNIKLSPYFNEIQPVDISRQNNLKYVIKGVLIKENSHE